MKDYQKGQQLHTLATVEKVKNGKPTVLLIEGERYVLDHKDRWRPRL